MIARRLLLVGIAVGLLAHAYPSAQVTSREGFLRRTLHPNLTQGTYDLIFDRLCRSAAGLRRLPGCPTIFSEPLRARNFFPPAFIAANLPHLRLDIILRREENKVVAGDGVSFDASDIAQFLYATWKIQSLSADDQYPDLLNPLYHDGVGVPAPQPGEVADNIQNANLLYRGVILNGCSATTVFDVDLESTIIRNNDTIGSVHLYDNVVGNGLYVFAYTIRATVGDDVSDFIISGDAPAYCTADPSV